MSSSDLAGNIAAIAYDKYAAMLYRLCAVQLGNISDAEDVVQDVFVKYISALPVFNDEEHEKAWFIRVAINRCHDKRRSKFFRNTVPLESISELAAADEGSSALEELMRLPEKYRSPLVLHYVEGYSVKEIARIMELTEATVKVRLHRARAQLKVEVEEGYGYVRTGIE